ncbi:MAG: flagellar assembly protein FliW [Anaerovoracaceae bacterium]|jgi:flagellar assembly factor FliW
MNINTRDFGIVSVDDDAIYHFPQGIYGFEEDTQFALFKQDFDELSFLYLQSTQNIIPSFLVFEPWDFYPGYAPQISPEDLKACQVDSIEDLIFLVIATVPQSIEDLSLNIKSPVVLNPKSKQGRQVILENSDYTVRYKPFQQSGKAGV